LQCDVGNKKGLTAVPLDKVLTEKEREITELGVGQLLAKLSKGELKMTAR
jgi:hypothetical protein